MATVVMPAGAAAGGEAFELLASRYLCRHAGLEFVASPFYKRLRGRKWVQFDGLLGRGDGARLTMEAKFHEKPVSLATPGITARIAFTKEIAAAGIILVSRSGFRRDVTRLRLPIEKVLLSWPGIRKRLLPPGDCLLTAALDAVRLERGGFKAASGAMFAVDAVERPLRQRDGFAFLPPGIERWVRRLPASPRDLPPDSP
ncbi:MAG: hypothetical protein ACYTAN_15640, partial [Planctomycetota bacterium]